MAFNIKYFENENIQIVKRKADDCIPLTDEEINQKYASGEVRIVTEQARYPLDTTLVTPWGLKLNANAGVIDQTVCLEHLFKDMR